MGPGGHTLAERDRDPRPHIPHWDSSYGPPPGHRLSSDQVQAELAGGGFTTEVIDEELPYQYVIVARK